MPRLLWTQKQDTGPLPRMGHAMAFHNARDRVILFGGDSLRSKLFNDTWEWDGEDWTQVADTGPSGRSMHAMAHAADRQRTVLFGGDGSSSATGDTWEWDGEDWTQVADTGPPLRGGHAMTFDATRGRVVLFGGRASSMVLGDTWEWDGFEWTQQEDTGPPARERHAMAYDTERRRTVLFGGLSGGESRGDTWEWDGTAWKQVAGFGPDAPCASAMVFKIEKVEVFGGISSLDISPPPALFQNIGNGMEDTGRNGRTWAQRPAGATPWPMIKRAIGSSCLAGFRTLLLRNPGRVTRYLAIPGSTRKNYCSFRWCFLRLESSTSLLRGLASWQPSL